MKTEPSEKKKKKRHLVKTEPNEEERKKKKKRHPVKTEPNEEEKEKKKVSWSKVAVKWVPHVCLIIKMLLSYELWKQKIGN